MEPINIAFLVFVVVLLLIIFGVYLLVRWDREQKREQGY